MDALKPKLSSSRFCCWFVLIHMVHRGTIFSLFD